MNCSVVRKTPAVPAVRSVVLCLTVDEAIQLQRVITSQHHASIKDRVFDALTQIFRTGRHSRRHIRMRRWAWNCRHCKQWNTQWMLLCLRCGRAR